MNTEREEAEAEAEAEEARPARLCGFIPVSYAFHFQSVSKTSVKCETVMLSI